jgi:hypothetical protein
MFTKRTLLAATALLITCGSAKAIEFAPLTVEIPGISLECRGDKGASLHVFIKPDAHEVEWRTRVAYYGRIHEVYSISTFIVKPTSRVGGAYLQAVTFGEEADQSKITILDDNNAIFENEKKSTKKTMPCKVRP